MRMLAGDARLDSGHYLGFPDLDGRSTMAHDRGGEPRDLMRSKMRHLYGCDPAKPKLPAFPVVASCAKHDVHARRMFECILKASKACDHVGVVDEQNGFDLLLRQYGNL